MIFIFNNSNNKYVYFILNKNDNTVKIGYTKNNPIKRLKQLQTGSSNNLELLYYFNVDSIATEKYLHRYFDFDRVRDNGEWFNYSDNIRNWIINDRYIRGKYYDK